MKEITLVGDDSDLQAIRMFYGTDPVIFILKLLKTMEELQLIDDSLECAGLDIHEVLDLSNAQLGPVLIHAFDKTSKGIEKIVNNLRVFAMLHDCEMCGCEVETFEDGGFGKTWTEGRCTGPNCDYAFSNEPDWDTFYDRG